MPRPSDTNKPEDTARQRARLAQERQKEQTESQGRMAMASTFNQINEEAGVFDPVSGDLVEKGVTEAQEEQVIAQHAELRNDDEVIEGDAAHINPLGMVNPGGPRVGPLGVPIPSDLAGPDPDQIESTVGMVAAAAAAVPSLRRKNQGEVVVRMAADVQPTIGQGSPAWDLKRGKRYRLPRNVADHLKEKGVLLSYN